MSEQKSVFISYCREDEPHATRLADQLKDRGLRVWIDRKNLPFGRFFAGNIRKNIRKADSFLFLVSSHLLERDSGGFWAELNDASRRAEELPPNQSYCYVVELQKGIEIPDDIPFAAGSLDQLTRFPYWKKDPALSRRFLAQLKGDVPDEGSTQGPRTVPRSNGQAAGGRTASTSASRSSEHINALLNFIRPWLPAVLCALFTLVVSRIFNGLCGTVLEWCRASPYAKSLVSGGLWLGWFAFCWLIFTRREGALLPVQRPVRHQAVAEKVKLERENRRLRRELKKAHSLSSVTEAGSGTSAVAFLIRGMLVCSAASFFGTFAVSGLFYQTVDRGEVPDFVYWFFGSMAFIAFAWLGMLLNGNRFAKMSASGGGLLYTGMLSTLSAFLAGVVFIQYVPPEWVSILSTDRNFLGYAGAVTPAYKSVQEHHAGLGVTRLEMVLIVRGICVPVAAGFGGVIGAWLGRPATAAA